MNDFDSHIPVMMDEVLKYLDVKDGETILDCTFGAGGYTKSILNSAKCNVIAVDRDLSVKVFADKVKEKFEDRFAFYNMKYSEVGDIIEANGLDAMVLDIGVSSMQIDRTERGFSFQKNARLDMRMGNEKTSAYDIVNNAPETEIADIIYNYGDEVKSRHIAKKIVEQRQIKPIETTFELANIVRSFYPVRNGKIDPATKTFQAIRIAVNDELNELKKILVLSKKLLKKGGRLVVVSFHSLEDKIVKEFIKNETDKGEKKDKYSTNTNDNHSFKLLTNRVISPTDEEIKSNVRARSAKLRALQKC